jgi:GDPmannose 4,6-dehydratase
MWLMLQQDAPDDYVIATGESHSVREFLDAAFGFVGRSWRDYVEIDPRYIRPAEVDHLQGNTQKAVDRLGWHPRVTFRQLVDMMMEHDLEQARGERILRDAGHQTTTVGDHR